MADNRHNADGTGHARYLIVRLGAMGDVIHGLAAAQALRAAVPGCEIGWVIEERWAELLCAPGSAREGPVGPERPVADAVYTVNTRAWRKQLFSAATWRDIGTLVARLRDRRFDVAIDIQGAIKSAGIAALSRAEHVHGFEQPRERIATMFYSHRHPARGRHVVEQNLSLIESVTHRPAERIEFPLPVDATSEQWADEFVSRLNSAAVAILNPGAGWGAKRWPGANYGRVAASLAARGVTPLINFGPGEENIAAEVERASGGSARELRCTVSQLTALTRRTALFVGGDTGPMHLAAAVGVPVVALFGPTDPARNGPYGSPSVVLRNRQSATSYKHVDRVDEGLHSITVNEAVEACERLLESR